MVLDLDEVVSYGRALREMAHPKCNISFVYEITLVPHNRDCCRRRTLGDGHGGIDSKDGIDGDNVLYRTSVASSLICRLGE